MPTSSGAATVIATQQYGRAYRYRNANKRAAVVDLHSPDDRERFETLLDAADVLIENLGPEQRRAHDLMPADVEHRHPRLVQVSLTDFGSSGPRSEWRLEPLTALAASGTMWATGFPDRPPCWLPGYLAHDCAPIYGGVGLAAILDREQRARAMGRDQHAGSGAGGHDAVVRRIADYLHNPRLNAKGTCSADGAYWVLPAKIGCARSSAAASGKACRAVRLA